MKQLWPLLLTFTLIVTGIAYSQQSAGPASRPVIISARAFLGVAPPQMDISGQNFGSAPQVTLITFC